jgi:hypothetical protein
VAVVQKNEMLHQAARELVERAVAMARVVQAADKAPGKMTRAGRKASAGAMTG